MNRSAAWTSGSAWGSSTTTTWPVRARRAGFERADPAEAARLWHAVLAECPGDREALVTLDRLQPAPKEPAGR